MPETETKEEFNTRIQRRWDSLMAEGKRGHYETLFKLCREVESDQREVCALIAEDMNQPVIAMAIRGDLDK